MKYEVSIGYKQIASITVEADSEEEAIKKAGQIGFDEDDIVAGSESWDWEDIEVDEAEETDLPICNACGRDIQTDEACNHDGTVTLCENCYQMIGGK